MNEREIAAGFPAVWSEFFPMLSPAFIIAFNAALVSPIRTRRGFSVPGRSKIQSHHPDVIAELGFRLAAAAYESASTVERASSDESTFKAAHAAAVARIRGFRTGVSPNDLVLNEEERSEGKLLATVYEEFIQRWPEPDRAEFAPSIKGSGVLNSCYADLAIGNTLFEVKTVTRPFQSKDLRQLLVYLALQSMSEEKRWENGGLFNPRIGVFCTFSIEWLVVRLSGGRPPRLVFSDFLHAVSRDAVIDHRF